MQGNREVQGRREQLRILHGVSQVHMVNTSWLNSQCRPYGARRIRPDIAPLRSFPDERRNLLGQLNTVMPHFAREGEGEKTHRKGPAAAPQQIGGEFLADRACTYVTKTAKKKPAGQRDDKQSFPASFPGGDTV